MAAIINLEDLPQLVMEKITSFLNHKQLLRLEQVSRKLKCAVDDHFSITDHLIIGHVPEVRKKFDYYEVTAKEKKCLDGLLQVLIRCGINLRTIQITVTYKCTDFAEPYDNYTAYIRHFFASAEVSNNCPNIESIITSPNVHLLNTHHYLFRHKQILLTEYDVAMYANNIKSSQGGTCKLRSIRLYGDEDEEREALSVRHRRFLNLFSNIVQLSVYGDGNGNFVQFLPQLIENGLKDLFVHGSSNLGVVKKCCNSGKNLRTLSLGIRIEDKNIAALNELQLSKNVELRTWIDNVDCIAQLNENVCNSIAYCGARQALTNCALTKLKNLHEFEITNSEQPKVMAEGAFPKLKMIKLVNDCRDHNCDVCDLQRYLPQLLMDKGNQLTYIKVRLICVKAMDAMWKALKHCTAAVIIHLHLIFFNSTSVTADDLRAICDLPMLQQLEFCPNECKENDACRMLRQLMKTTVAEYTGLQFTCEFKHGIYGTGIYYTLSRIHF